MSKEADCEIPQGQPQEVIGGGVAVTVVHQLIARENLISQKHKTKEHLLFFNANGAWVRMLSSVNTLTAEQASELLTGKTTIQDTVGDNTLARKNILTGGVLNQDNDYNISKFTGGVSETRHNPITLDEQGFVTPGDPKTNSYHNYESLGFRPTPGITSVSITSKGTYGTLREGVVEFKVWTLEDLEVMQALYLRPGYSVLVEWGHSLQLDSKESTIVKEIATYSNFFDDCLADPMSQFEQGILEISQGSGHNYDGFVGYVSNFDWSLNQEGGYDCSAKIIAKGSVLESISATFDPSFTYPADQFTRSSKDKTKKEKKSIYHKLFAEMEYWTSRGSSAQRQVIGGTVLALRPGGGTLGAGLSVALPALGAAIADALYGSKEEALNSLNVIEGEDARIAMENDAFKAKFEKLLEGDTFFFNNKQFIFGKAGDGGFGKLAEKPLNFYLTRQFKEYGFTFRDKFDFVDKIVAKAETGKEFQITKRLLDGKKLTSRNSLNMANFIQDNARLPEYQLTDEQKQAKIVRKEAAKQQEADQSANLATSKQANARTTGYASEGEVEPIYTKSSFKRDNSQHFKDTLNDFAAFRLKGLELKGSGWLDNDNLNEFWIPLSLVLDVFNNYVSTRNLVVSTVKGSNSPGKKLTQFYTGWQDDGEPNEQDVPTGQYQKSLKYLTSDLHFSINPMVCILPKRPKSIILKDSEGKDIEWPDGSTSFPLGVVYKNGFHQQVESAFNQGLMRGDSDDILNILISVQFLQDELDKIVQEDEDSDQNENNNIVHFLTIVLRAMNEAMGGINDLDLFYDEQDDRYYIIDRKVTPALRNLIPTLSLSGLKSTMFDVQISSQISKNIGNMVAIAAQGTGGNSKDNVGTLLKWNTGLLDRHVRHKSDTGDGEEVKEKRENPEDTRLKKWVEDYYDYWREFNGSKNFDNGDFNADIVPSISGYHKKFCQKYVVEEYSKGQNPPKPTPGTIPVELSFTTTGIGGLKIGQAFQIEQGLLPHNYAENFGYIITGLSHSIADARWTTQVKTQFYSIKPPTDEEIKAYQENTGARTVGFVQPDSPTAGGVAGPVLVVDGEDPAPIINPNRIGGANSTETPVYKKFKIDLRLSSKSNVLELVKRGDLIEIGDANSDPKHFAGSMGTAKLLDGKYYLQSTAGRAFSKWINELKQKNIQFLISSAVRFGPNLGGGPHGYGIAVDFSNLYQIVGGSTSTTVNLNARKQNPSYREIAEIGAKYGWYNPWRLSDNAGTMDEIWHFEYWGQA